MGVKVRLNPSDFGFHDYGLSQKTHSHTCFQKIKLFQLDYFSVHVHTYVKVYGSSIRQLFWLYKLVSLHAHSAFQYCTLSPPDRLVTLFNFLC